MSNPDNNFPPISPSTPPAEPNNPPIASVRPSAVNKLDGMADYIDAMHDRGKAMSEQVNLEEDICDGNIRLSEGRMKELHGYIQRGMSAREIAKKMKLDVKTIEALMKEEVELDEAVLAGRDYKYDGKGPIKISK